MLGAREGIVIKRRRPEELSKRFMESLQQKLQGNPSIEDISKLQAADLAEALQKALQKAGELDVLDENPASWLPRYFWKSLVTQLVQDIRSLGEGFLHSQLQEVGDVILGSAPLNTLNTLVTACMDLEASIPPVEMLEAPAKWLTGLEDLATQLLRRVATRLLQDKVKIVSDAAGLLFSVLYGLVAKIRV